MTRPIKTMDTQSIKTQGRLQRYLDGDGQGISIDRHRLPEFLLQANQLLQAGQDDQARALFTEANLAIVDELVRDDPSVTDVMYILAKLLQDAELTDLAVTWYERIVAVEPHAKVLAQWGQCVSPFRAVELLRQAHDMAPDDVDIMQGYARSLVSAGQIEAGIEMLQAVLRQDPQALELQYGVIWHRHFLPGYDNAYFKQAYSHWARQYYGGRQPLPRPVHDRDPHRRLRIGWVSGDFKNNSPLTPFELVCRLFDRDSFELVAYANVADPNDGTDRWRDIMDVYRDIRDLDDRAAAQWVVDDRIDILLEVGGHCGGSRLGVFAYEPAPVQVDYGALSTVGLPALKHRFSCPVLDPPENLQYYQEQTHYLVPMSPYTPPSPSPTCTALPARTHGYVTFGLFNNLRKMNSMSMDLWARILHQVPQARAIQKCPQGDDPELVRYYQGQWAQRGIDPQRIGFYGEVPHLQHLEVLGQCDLMLDSFPYNAARGTMEALWMGVPTVTLTGETFVSREGLAIQKQVGLEVFAATTTEEYVAKAVSFAGQCDHLAAIRQSLRQRMLASPLCDPQGWTLKFQQALRDMWQEWCRNSLGER